MTVRKLPSGKYQADYIDGAGRRHRKQFKLKKDAEACVNEKGHLVRSGRAFDEAAARRPFRDYATSWWDDQPSTPNYNLNVRAHLNNHILPVLGELPIGSITRQDIQAMIKRSSKVLGVTSLHSVMKTARMIIRAAIADRVLPGDPFAGVKLPKIPKKHLQVLELDQVYAITDAILPRYRALCLFTAQSGMRQGEVFGIRVTDIDWSDPKVTVRRQIQSYTGEPRTVQETKTKTDRTIPLMPETLDMLKEHMAEFPPGELGYLFTNTLGRPLHRRVFDRAWVNARTRAAKRTREELEEKYVGDPIQLALELPRADILAEAKFHGLRHFYASALIRAGEDVGVVAARLGHANPAMTLRVYAHLFRDNEARTRDALRATFLRSA